MITKDTLKTLRDEINEAMLAIAAKHNLASLRLGNGSYTDSTFTFKLEGLENGGLTREAQRYESLRETCGLPPLGADFGSQGHRYKITGLNSTGSKVIARRADGKSFLFTTDGIRRLFDKASAA